MQRSIVVVAASLGTYYVGMNLLMMCTMSVYASQFCPMLMVDWTYATLLCKLGIQLYRYSVETNTPSTS
jgi:hypothetical protein